MTIARPRLPLALFGIAWLLAASACSWTPSSSAAIKGLDELPDAVTTTVAPAPTDARTTVAPAPTDAPKSARERDCDDRSLQTASYAPASPSEVPPGSFMEQLRERGAMRVGVDENTPGFSARDRNTGRIEGFEVALAHEIARYVFGDAYTDDSVVTVPLVPKEKVDFVDDQRVDLTISAVSMSCDRWEQVDFSAEYFTAHQEFLVRSDSDIHDLADLDGRTICVTTKSTSSEILAARVPAAKQHPVDARIDCLVALQDGVVDAYFGHDSFLYGMTKQDPTVEIRNGILDPDVTVSHYGIAINRAHPEFTRFVNGVLEAIVANGTWQQLADEHLARIGIIGVNPPEPDYRRDA
jgi:polar amino acid transport system substrate-binding protein